jgi:hypothetical protein
MDDEPGDVLSALITTVHARFPDLDFFGPQGILELHEALPSVDRLRIELPPDQFLHLQSIGVSADGVDDVAALAEVQVSSWYKDFGEKFDKARLFDFDSPTGTVVHTGGNETAWLEVTFSRPLDITGVRLRNVADANAPRAHGIRVLAGSPGQDLTVVYDAADRAVALAELLDELAAPTRYDIGDEMRAMLPVIVKTMTGDYGPARTIEKATPLSDPAIRHYRKVINATILNARSMELTPHGLKRSFRYWTPREKKRYINFAVAVADDLKRLTPNACFGFGAALAVVRDGDLIPHDDDLDLIIGFEPHEAATLQQARKLVKQHLKPLGYKVSGAFSAHWHVGKPGFRHQLDVFVGLFEGDTISWYPGARGSLTRQIMFPTSEVTMLGISCPVPHDSETYLERVYGPGWRQPDPGFMHKWDPTAYADLRSTTA